MKIKADQPSVVCSLLGFTGAAIPIVVGFYLVSTMANLTSLQDETSQIWIATAATTIAALATSYGSLMILNSNARKGGRINIAGGAVMVVAYIYFSEFTQPKLLQWLNPLGIALTIPPLLSGVIILVKNHIN